MGMGSTSLVMSPGHSLEEMMEDDSWADSICSGSLKEGTGGAASSGTQAATPQPLTEAGTALQDTKAILSDEAPSVVEALKPPPTYAELKLQLDAIEKVHKQGTAGAMPADPP